MMDADQGALSSEDEAEGEPESMTREMFLERIDSATNDMHLL